MSTTRAATFDLVPLSDPSKETKREIDRVIGHALTAQMAENGRALLATTALQNVGALSALEQHLNQVAPSGAARYKLIVDTYALSAARTIAGF